MPVVSIYAPACLQKAIMPDTNSQRNLSFRFIIRSQYFLYFGVMGIFLPYFNLYCYHIGFSGFQIGVLSALRSSAMVVCSLMWGRLADRFRIRRPVYILCNFVSTGIWTFFLLTSDFRMIVLITIGYSIFYAPIISFLEAFTMDILGHERKSYGSLRVWGSVAFIAAVTVLGKVIAFYSTDIILKLILFGSVLQAVFSLRIPDIREPENMKPARSLSNPRSGSEKRKILIFLSCAFLMLVSHGTYYGFFSIHLEKLGVGSTMIGAAWALASVSEILVMIGSDRIFRRFPIEKVLFFSFMTAALRWAILFFATSPAVIIMSQVLHAITYGTFHIASILYMDEIGPDGSKTTGQALNNAVTYGLGMMIGFFANGYLYEFMGTFNLFGISSVTALTGGIILHLFHKA